MASFVGPIRSSPVPRPSLARRSIATGPLPRSAFAIIFYFSLTNLVILATYTKQKATDLGGELPIYPVLFFVCAAVILVSTTSRRGGKLLLVSWIFWIVYAFGGFIGPARSSGSGMYQMGMILFKPWMSLVGLPWLAVRVVSPNKLPSLLRGAVLATAAFATLGLGQVLIPGFLEDYMIAPGRASSLWYNPNNMGFVCASAVFVSLLCPFQRKWLTLLCRIILLLGIMATLSRGAIVVILCGWIVYGFTSGRVATVLKSLTLIGVFVIGMIVLLPVLQPFLGKQASERLSNLQGVLAGEWTTETVQDTRTQIWLESIEAILRGGGAMIGLGHGSMAGIVNSGDGLNPHNLFIAVWGNSGILALLMLLTYFFLFFFEASKCDSRNTRAALFGLATVLVVTGMFDDSVMPSYVSSPILAIFLLSANYGRSPLRAPAVATSGSMAIRSV